MGTPHMNVLAIRFPDPEPGTPQFLGRLRDRAKLLEGTVDGARQMLVIASNRLDAVKKTRVSLSGLREKQTQVEILSELVALLEAKVDELDNAAQPVLDEFVAELNRQLESGAFRW